MIFKNLKRKGKITEKELKYFIINHKKLRKDVFVTQNS